MTTQLATLYWTLRKIERKNDFEYQVIDGAGEVVATRRSKRDYVACFVYASKDPDGSVKYSTPFFFGRPDRIGKGESAQSIKAGRRPNAIALIETWRNHNRPGAWSDYPLTRTADGTPIVPDYSGNGISWYEIPHPFTPGVLRTTAINLAEAAANADEGVTIAAEDDDDSDDGWDQNTRRPGSARYAQRKIAGHLTTPPATLRLFFFRRPGQRDTTGDPGYFNARANRLI